MHGFGFGCFFQLFNEVRDAGVHFSSNVRQLVVVQSLDVVFLHERVYVLLDVWNLWWEAGLDLTDDFFDKMDVLEFFPRLHDAYDSSLNRDSESANLT